MKARRTGSGSSYREVVMIQLEDSDILYRADCVEFELEPETPRTLLEDDIRTRAAISAMCGLLSAPPVDGVDPNPSAEKIAELSVRLSDALIKELKK